MSQVSNNVAAELAGATVGCRVRFSWLGASRTLDDNQNERAAEVFGANADALRVQKKIFDDRRPEYRQVNRRKTELRDYWRNHTLPFTEPGVRLLRRDNVGQFSDGFSALCDELAADVNALDNVYAELLNEARERLGELFNAADYPASLQGKFTAAFDFPNLAPPDYLAQLSPELFERERQRVAGQFAESVELAERAFSDELASMLARIVDTLNGSTDGKPKIFRDSMLENVGEFFGRFRSLNITGSAELAALVERAQSALAGVTPNALRASVHVRDMVKTAVAGIHAELSAGIVDRPLRRLQFATPPASSATPPEQPATVAPVVEPQRVAPVGSDIVGTSTDVEPQPVVELMNAEPVELASMPEPVAEPVGATVEPQRVVELASMPANVGTSATPPEQPATVAPVAELASMPATPSNRPAFAFNYGNGRRLVVAG